MAEQQFVPFDAQLLDNLKHHRYVEVKLVLSKSPNLVKSCDGWGTLLHYAALYVCSKEIFQYLISLGSEIDYAGKGGNTPLMLAVQSRNVFVVDVLLEANANVYTSNDQGNNVLQMLFEDSGIYGRRTLPSIMQTRLFYSELYRMFKAIIRRVQSDYPNLDEVAEKLTGAGCRLYHVAVLQDLRIMESVLKQGVNVNAQNSIGETALHIAAGLSDLDMVKWLINNGADVKVVDVDGCGPVFKATDAGNPAILHLLLEQGDNPDCETRVCVETISTPLLANLVPNINNNLKELDECTELLLQHGAIRTVSQVRNLSFMGCSVFEQNFHREGSEGINYLVAHMAILDIPDNVPVESFIFCHRKWNRPKILKYIDYYKACQQTLKIKAFKTLSVLDLLSKSEREMRILVRNQTFVSIVEEVCSRHKIKEVYTYYYNTLMKNISKATLMVKLEERAITALHDIFMSSDNEFDMPARQIVSYLSKSDLEHLCEV